MGGLARICKMYGGMKFKDQNGNTIEWVYDYANDKPRLKSEMTKKEMRASEKAKWQGYSEQLSIQKGLQQAADIHAGKTKGKTFDEFLEELP